MEKQYLGTIVGESLEDDSILKNFEIVDSRISDDENPADRWHLYKVRISRDEINQLVLHIKEK